ncbi:oxidoreductase [Devosia sp. Root685]|nr:NAD(P)-binding domain-containing protein [Devosia sp. Root685]KRA96574.1 oxidoreductase [Devosia sp. Root685]
MTTAIIGLGNMGSGLARRLAGNGNLVLAARNEAAATTLAQDIGAKSASVDAAIAAADTVILALPYDAALALAKSGALDGKVVVDISNPVKPDFSGLAFGFDTSAAEEIQKAAPGAKVVKAFNTIFASLFAAPRDNTANVPVFLAGEDAALEKVETLVKNAGFAVEKTGTLDAARLLEPLGMLNIRFGYGLGRGTSIAPAWLSV